MFDLLLRACSPERMTVVGLLAGAVSIVTNVLALVLLAPPGDAGLLVVGLNAAIVPGMQLVVLAAVGGGVLRTVRQRFGVDLP